MDGGILDLATTWIFRARAGLGLELLKILRVLSNESG